MRSKIIMALTCLGLLGLPSPVLADRIVRADLQTDAAPEIRLVFQGNHRKTEMHAQQTAKGQNSLMQNVIGKLKAAKKDTGSLKRNQRIKPNLQ